MDIECLCEIVIKATIHTLRYHVGAEITWIADVQATIREEIYDLHPLRDMAQDTSVADLEIACDAALTVAEAYNKSFPEQPSINLRWFYICVQGLLLPDIKPELLLDGKVDRLPRKTDQQLSNSDSESESLSPAGSSLLGSDSPASSPEQSAPSSKDTKRVCTKAPKAKWAPDEIQLIVELKASGMRHCEIAMRLGRGQGSVENKYGRVMQKIEWKDYSSEFEANLLQKERDGGI